MKQNRRIVPILVISSLLAVVPFIAAGAPNVIDNPLGRGATFERVINNIVRYANLLLAPLATIMVLVAGLMYMTSGGNEERLKTARQTLLWAVVGIAIVLISNGALAIIKSALGVSATP